MSSREAEFIADHGRTELAPLAIALHQILVDSSLAVAPTRRHYLPGEIISAQLHDQYGHGITPSTEFLIERFLGGGWSGQVYQAINIATGDAVALKPLRPASDAKELFRNALFFIAFGIPFPDSSEIATQTSLIRQDLLRQEVDDRARLREKEGKPNRVRVNQSVGYYFDPSFGCYVEVHQYVPGRQSMLEVDDQAFERWGGLARNAVRRISGQEPLPIDSEMGEKQQAMMEELTPAAEALGMDNVSRQFRVFTLIGVTNVVHVVDSMIEGRELEQIASDHRPLVAIDTRPGLTVLPFIGMLMSPYDFWRGLKDIFKLRFKPRFDQTDLNKLANYFMEKRGYPSPNDAVNFGNEWELYRRETAYWQMAKKRQGKQAAFIDNWLAKGFITVEKASHLREKGYSLWYSMRKLIPGPQYDSFLSHLSRTLFEPRYRNTVFKLFRARHIQEWLANNNITPQRGNEMINSTRSVLWFMYAEKPVRKIGEKVNEYLIEPVKLFFNFKDFRMQWLQERITEAQGSGQISSTLLSRLDAELAQSDLKWYLRDFTRLLIIEGASKVATLPLAAYIGAEINPLLGAGLVAWQFLPVPISPSGLARGAYVALATIIDTPSVISRSWRTFGQKSNLLNKVSHTLSLSAGFWSQRLAAAGLSLIKTFGNGAIPAMMAWRFPGVTVITTRHITRKAANFAPGLGGVFGTEGGVIETAMFDLMLNLPLSVRKKLRVQLGL